VPDNSISGKFVIGIFEAKVYPNFFAGLFLIFNGFSDR
jgi:hypothetical protein